MSKITYEAWTPKADAIQIIAHATVICEDYQAQGYDLTLRQLYYQFVARGLIDNSDRSYKRLGSIVNKARMAGLLDWSFIVDRTRNVRSLGHYENPAQIIDVATRAFRLDRWETQPVRIEVWVEKEALAGVVERVAQRHDVAWFSCRGYVSQSELWGAAQRLRRYVEDGQRVVVLHLGDHDPSGIDMTRDIRERLALFTETDWVRRTRDEWVNRTPTYSAVRASMKQRAGLDPAGWVEAIEVDRIALNWDQVEEYDPPPNPAKMTDSRVDGYIDQYGYSSWELDALDPATLDALIEEKILALRDRDAWDEMEEREQHGRDLLSTVSVRWDEVEDLFGGES